MKYTVEAGLQFSPNGDKVQIEVATSDGLPLSYQEVLDTVVDLLITHYGLVALPKERNLDDGKH